MPGAGKERQIFAVPAPADRVHLDRQVKQLPQQRAVSVVSAGFRSPTRLPKFDRVLLSYVCFRTVG